MHNTNFFNMFMQYRHGTCWTSSMLWNVFWSASKVNLHCKAFIIAWAFLSSAINVDKKKGFREQFFPAKILTIWARKKMQN